MQTRPDQHRLTRPIGQELGLCLDGALTHEPCPEPLGQWGESVRAATRAAWATCCSGIMQLDTAFRMMEHREFSTLTTPMATDHCSQHWPVVLGHRKTGLLILCHRCFFVFSPKSILCFMFWGAAAWAFSKGTGDKGSCVFKALCFLMACLSICCCLS